MLRRVMIATGLLLATAVFADDQYQAIPESASGLIYPGDEAGGDILNPDAGWDGDFATFTEAASNGNTSNAITWETTEIYQIPVQAQNVRLHFKTEQYHYQSTSEVYAYDFPAGQYVRLFIENGPDEAPLVSEQTLSLDPQYFSNGEVRVRVVLFAKHNSSAYARYFESEIVYMMALGQVNAIIVDPAAPDRVFAAANAVWKSADGGLEWTRMELTPPWGPSCCSWVGSLIMDPNDGNTLYAGPGNGVYNIWKTTDGGNTWNELDIDPAIVPDGATNLTVSDYAIDPVGDILYASAYSGGPGMEIVSDVYASADGGTSWQRTNLDIFADDLAYDPVHARLFAATTAGIYAYSGGTWAQIGLAGENATSVAVAPDDPQTIYAGLGHTGVGGTEGTGLWRGAYDGAVWQWSDISIPTGVRVASLALDQDDPNVIYAGSQWSSGLFKSTDGGGSWVSVGPAPAVSWVPSVTIDPTNSDVVYAGTRFDGPGYMDGDIYKSTDAGATWTLLNVEETTAPVSVSVVVPEVTATHGQVIGVPVQIAGVSAPGIVSAEVFLSYDSGLLALNGVQTAGTLTEGWSIETNLVSGAGATKTLRIAAATDDQEITTDGVLLNISFTVADLRSPASSPLTLEHVLLNDGDPENAPADGSVTLVGVDGSIVSLPAEIIPRWSVGVSVYDGDEDRDSGARDGFDVGVTNGGQTEVLGVSETGPNTGVFSGVIGTKFSLSPISGDGVVQAAAGDSLRFCYVDSLDGLGSVKTRCDLTTVRGGKDGVMRVTVVSQPGDTVRVRVTDADLSDAVNVDVTNPRTGESEDILLSAFSGGSSVFYGRFFTDTQAGGDSTLEVAKGDTLVVVYADTLRANGGTADVVDDDEVVDPFGDAHPNGSVQAFDAAQVLIHRLSTYGGGVGTLSGLDSLSANVDQGAPFGIIDGYDASLILRKVVGLISRFEVQAPDAVNHPQPETASRPKPVGEERELALVPGEGYVSVWCEDRRGIVSGELRIEGIEGQVVMGEKLAGFLAVSEVMEDGLRIVFAGSEAVSGEGELLRVEGVSSGEVRLTDGSFNGGRIGARWEGSASSVSVPLSFALLPNVPNPFNPETMIGFSLARESRVRLEVFDAVGQRVRVLVSEWLPAGAHRVVWDGRGEGGELVGSGVYFYRLQARHEGDEWHSDASRPGDLRFVRVRRMMLLK